MRNNRFSHSHFKNPFSSARFNTVAGLFTARIRRLLLRQAICIALILSLLFLPGSSYAFSQAPALAASLARVAVLPVEPLVSIIRKLFRAPVRQQETTADRTSRVSVIRIEPGKLVGYLNQRVSFSAVGKDSLGNTAQGARFEWSSSDEPKLRIDDSGQAMLLNPGLVWVTASTRFASSRVPVLIRPRARGTQTDDEWKADQDDLRPDGSTGTTGIGSLIFSGRSAYTAAETGLFPNGEFGATVSDRSDVYLNPDLFPGTTLLHEALHSLTGKNDGAIAQQLGLSPPSGSESSAISTALRDNDCVPKGE